MVERLKFKLFGFLAIIPLYYIVGDKNLFVYVASICLYNIFLSCFNDISLKKRLKEIDNSYKKHKIFKFSSIIMIILCLLFLIFGIIIGDLIETFLGVTDTFFTFFMMGLSLIITEYCNLCIDYFSASYTNKRINRLISNYHYGEIFLFLIISLISFRIFDAPVYISNGLLYLSNIIVRIFVLSLLFVFFKFNKKVNKEEKRFLEVDYKKEFKEIFTNNFSLKMFSVIKNSYYYMSVIILYMILSIRYNYLLNDVSNIIVFIYFYGLYIMDFIVFLISYIINYFNKKEDWLNKIYLTFDKLLTISIILGIISPFVCKIIFNSSDNSIYLMMLGIMAIFVSLYNLTFENIKNDKILYISLILGIFAKLLLVIPLIDSFYRTGYNLIYGDIISTIIGMFISFIINYIYLKIKYKKELHLERILTILYENIILCILLVVIQFIIPVKSYGYFKSFILMIIYLVISIMFLKFKLQLKKKN